MIQRRLTIDKDPNTGLGEDCSPSSRGQWRPQSLTSLTLQHWGQESLVMGWGSPDPRAPEEDPKLPLFFLLSCFWNPISNPQLPHHGMCKISKSGSREDYLLLSTSWKGLENSSQEHIVFSALLLLFQCWFLLLPSWLCLTTRANSDSRVPIGRYFFNGNLSELTLIPSWGPLSIE